MKYDIATVIRTIIDHYHVNRGVGHTHTMVHGTQDSDCLVVVRNAGRNCYGVKTRNLRWLWSLPETLQGNRKPIIFDNYALQGLCESAYAEIERLNAEVMRLARKLQLSRVHESHQRILIAHLLEQLDGTGTPHANNGARPGEGTLDAPCPACRKLVDLTQAAGVALPWPVVDDGPDGTDEAKTEGAALEQAREGLRELLEEAEQEARDESR